MFRRFFFFVFLACRPLFVCTKSLVLFVLAHLRPPSLPPSLHAISPASRSRVESSSLRDSPTYEDFGDPLEARRKKRREERERAGGASVDAAGNGAGRGRQYISSFEVADSKVINTCVVLIGRWLMVDHEWAGPMRSAGGALLSGHAGAYFQKNKLSGFCRPISPPARPPRYVCFSLLIHGKLVTCGRQEKIGGERARASHAVLCVSVVAARVLRTYIRRCLFLLRKCRLHTSSGARPSGEATSRGRQKRQSVHRVEFRATPPRERTYVRPRTCPSPPLGGSAYQHHPTTGIVFKQ